MINCSHPSALLCAHCDSFLEPPLLVLLNCGHGIHKSCYAAIEDLSSSCHRCKALIITALPDEKLERCMQTIAGIRKAILDDTPHITASLLKKKIFVTAMTRGDKGIVRLLVEDDVPPNSIVEGVTPLSILDLKAEAYTGNVRKEAEDLVIHPRDTSTLFGLACKIFCFLPFIFHRCLTEEDTASAAPSMDKKSNCCIP